MRIPSAIAGAAAAALLATAGTAAAAPVLVLDSGRVVARDDPYVPAVDLPPPPPRPASKRKARPEDGPTVYEELQRLLAEGAIDQAAHDSRRRAYRRALKTRRRLSGARRAELSAAIANVEDMAARGAFSASRLEPIFLTLERNRRWWMQGRLLRHGTRVEFEGSEVVYQQYRGEGLQIQPLGSFGKANALWADERDAAFRDLLAELLPLAAERAGGLAWEYYFDFGGGEPPWTSGLSQATAVQAYARASQRLGDPALMDVVRRGLNVFEAAPPDGVRVDGPFGPHYLIYSFAPDLRVLNAFLQAVIGLHDVAELSGDPRARVLYETGDAQARSEVPAYDTGAWSLYSLERESDLSYHRLVTRFLDRLCDRTAAAVYCDTAARFKGYLDVDPTIRLLTSRVRGGRPANVRVQLSKISRVGLVVRTRDGARVLATSATLGHGKRAIRWSRPARPGLYDVTVTATDLAGNRAEPETGRIRVLPPKRRTGSR